MTEAQFCFILIFQLLLVNLDIQQDFNAAEFDLQYFSVDGEIFIVFHVPKVPNQHCYKMNKHNVPGKDGK